MIVLASASLETTIQALAVHLGLGLAATGLGLSTLRAREQLRLANWSVAVPLTVAVGVRLLLGASLPAVFIALAVGHLALWRGSRSAFSPDATS